MHTKNGNCRKPQHKTKHPIWQSSTWFLPGHLFHLYFILMFSTRLQCLCMPFFSLISWSCNCSFQRMSLLSIHFYFLFIISLSTHLHWADVCHFSHIPCTYQYFHCIQHTVDQAMIWYITFRQGLTLFEFTYLQDIINHNIILCVLSENVSLVI